MFCQDGQPKTSASESSPKKTSVNRTESSTSYEEYQKEKTNPFPSPKKSLVQVRPSFSEKFDELIVQIGPLSSKKPEDRSFKRKRTADVITLMDIRKLKPF